MAHLGVCRCGAVRARLDASVAAAAGAAARHHHLLPRLSQVCKQPMLLLLLPLLGPAGAFLCAPPSWQIRFARHDAVSIRLLPAAAVVCAGKRAPPAGDPVRHLVSTLLLGLLRARCRCCAAAAAAAAAVAAVDESRVARPRGHALDHGTHRDKDHGVPARAPVLPLPRAVQPRLSCVQLLHARQAFHAAGAGGRGQAATCSAR